MRLVIGLRPKPHSGDDDDGDDPGGDEQNELGSAIVEMIKAAKSGDAAKAAEMFRAAMELCHEES
jgi:hypothetical protein